MEEINLSHLTLKKRPAVTTEESSTKSKVAKSSPIGQCLERALNEIIAEDEDESRSNAQQELQEVPPTGQNCSKGTSVPLNKRMAARIVNKFCSSVSETNWEEEINIEDGSIPRHNVDGSTSITKRNSSTSTNKTPAAVLLKGKVKSYNRIENRWRIIVSNGSLLERRNIRRGDGTSNAFGGSTHKTVWETSSAAQGGVDGDGSIALDGLVQLLVYDDAT